MAIVQISRIQHRKGLQENVPQLAGAELGWAQDQRRLYVGNGTLAEGAPVIGNTEILTEFSDVLALAKTYTFKGTDAGYDVVTGNPKVERTIQKKLDEVASVKDFGAKGDGTTDDTTAINKAFLELFTREKNEEIRRSLYFPAGVYKITNEIKIPAYAKVFGEGMNSSIVRMVADDSTAPAYVVRTTDSSQQTGANIGTNSANLPKNIEVSSMSFETTDDTVSLLLVESAEQCFFDAVAFKGASAKAALTDATAGTSAVTVLGTSATKPTKISFDNCDFSNVTYGVKVDDDSKAFTFSNSRFHTLYRGVNLGESTTGTGPAGFRIMQCMFDDIADCGINFENISRNISAFNIFYDVGNNFNGSGNMVTNVIKIQSDHNVSWGDMFERSDTDDRTQARVAVTNTVNGIFTDNARAAHFGQRVLESGKYVVLANNQVSAADVVSVTPDGYSEFKIYYRIQRGDNRRTGCIHVTLAQGANAISYDDEYTENGATGILLSVDESSGNWRLRYTSTNTVAGSINYAVEHIN